MSKIGNRFRTIRTNYQMAREHDPRLGWILLSIFAVGIGGGIALGVATNNPVTWVLIGVSLSIVVAAIVTARRRRARLSNVSPGDLAQPKGPQWIATIRSTPATARSTPATIITRCPNSKTPIPPNKK